MFFSSGSSKNKKGVRSSLAIIIGTAGTHALVYSEARAQAAGNGETKSELNQPEVKNLIELAHDPVPVVEEKSLLRSIRRDIQEIKKKVAGISFDNVTIILSSPWYFSQTRKITMERGEQFIVDKDLIYQLLEEEKNIFLNRASSQFLIPQDDEPELLETAVMRALLNGYETDFFMNKNASQLQLSVYISMSMKKLVNELISVAEDLFGVKKAAVHSSPYILLKSASLMLEIENAGAVIVDIGGEVTDIVIIRDGMIDETLSFGRGLYFILRRIAGALLVTPIEALSYLRAQSSDHVSEKYNPKLQLIIDEAIKEWQQMFYEAIARAAQERMLASRFILIGGGAEFAIFTEAIKSGEWKKFLNKIAAIKIEVLYPNSLRRHMLGEGRFFSGSPALTQLFLAAASSEYFL